MLSELRVPILGFAAYSGTGKTTLLTQLLSMLKVCGLRVGMIKHAHHHFDIDQPGKDSYELRKAGATQMLVASSQRWALMVETEGQAEPRLDELVRHLDQDDLDLILVEGFKREAFPKIELHRKGLNYPLLFAQDNTIIAIATDDESLEVAGIPRLAISNVQNILHFILNHFSIGP